MHKPQKNVTVPLAPDTFNVFLYLVLYHNPVLFVHWFRFDLHAEAGYGEVSLLAIPERA